MSDIYNAEDTSQDTAPIDVNQDTSTFENTSDRGDFERVRDHEEPERERPRRRPRQSVKDTIREAFAEAQDTPQDQLDRTQDQERETEAQTDVENKPQSIEKSKSAEPPTAWRKEAKAKWQELPEDIKTEVLKREADTQRGVEALKKQYSDIDEAIAPYVSTIKQFQKTPAQAVGQLFQWFDALAKDPDRAFPALLQSYRYDPGRLLQSYGVDPNDLAQFIQYKQQWQAQQAQQGYQQQGQYQQGQPQQEEISPAVRQYIDGLHNELSELKQQVGYHFDGLAQTFAAQNQAKTQEMLERWAADKPYFNDVRVMMGHLLTPDPTTGQAAVPLTPDGRVDLDKAYEMAVFALPEVRERVLQEQQAQQQQQLQQQQAALKAKQEADYRAQQEKASRARQASSSLRPGSPGSQIGRQQAPNKGQTVRQSLQAAISELSER